MTLDKKLYSDQTSLINKVTFFLQNKKFKELNKLCQNPAAAFFIIKSDLIEFKLPQNIRNAAIKSSANFYSRELFPLLRESDSRSAVKAVVSQIIKSPEGAYDFLTSAKKFNLPVSYIKRALFQIVKSPLGSLSVLCLNEKISNFYRDVLEIACLQNDATRLLLQKRQLCEKTLRVDSLMCIGFSFRNAVLSLSDRRIAKFFNLKVSS